MCFMNVVMYIAGIVNRDRDGSCTSSNPENINQWQYSKNSKYIPVIFYIRHVCMRSLFTVVAIYGICFSGDFRFLFDMFMWSPQPE